MHKVNLDFPSRWLFFAYIEKREWKFLSVTCITRSNTVSVTEMNHLFQATSKTQNPHLCFCRVTHLVIIFVRITLATMFNNFIEKIVIVATAKE